MAYSESKELTDTEKRLQVLKTQLFGKERQVKTTVSSSHSTATISPSQHQDLTYLKKDLLKILILAMIAFFVQIMLYIQFNFRILKFN